jgi:hypothetical protein
MIGAEMTLCSTRGNFGCQKVARKSDFAFPSLQSASFFFSF